MRGKVGKGEWIRMSHLPLQLPHSAMKYDGDNLTWPSHTNSALFSSSVPSLSVYLSSFLQNVCCRLHFDPTYVDNTYHLIRRSMSCLYFFCCFGPPSTTTMFTSCKNISVRWQSLKTFVAWQFPQNFIIQKHPGDIFICQCQYYQSVNTLDLIKEDCASHEKLLSVFLQLPFLCWVPQIFHSSGKDLESFSWPVLGSGIWNREFRSPVDRHIDAGGDILLQLPCTLLLFLCRSQLSLLVCCLVVRLPPVNEQNER